MRFKELTERTLGGKFDSHCTITCGNLVEDFTPYYSDKPKENRFLLNFNENRDGVWPSENEKLIPFARTRKRLFGYDIKVEILPCMIPQALEALTFSIYILMKKKMNLIILNI